MPAVRTYNATCCSLLENNSTSMSFQTFSQKKKKTVIFFSDVILEQQVLFTKKMAPVVAEEYSQATLEVEVSLESGEVQWMRQGVLIHPGAKYTLKHQSFKHSLTVHKVAPSDRGTYSCETLHDRTQAQLTVERECARVLTMHSLFTPAADTPPPSNSTPPPLTPPTASSVKTINSHSSVSS